MKDHLPAWNITGHPGNRLNDPNQPKDVVPYLITFVAQPDELALQVHLVHRDAAAGGGVLTDAGLCHRAPHHAGGLAVVVVEAALLGAARAGGVAAAGGGGGGVEEAAGVAV